MSDCTHTHLFARARATVCVVFQRVSVCSCKVVVGRGVCAYWIIYLPVIQEKEAAIKVRSPGLRGEMER